MVLDFHRAFDNTKNETGSSFRTDFDDRWFQNSNSKESAEYLAENDIDRLYSLYQNYSDEEDYSRIVTLQEIRDKEYNLSPNRYVVYHKEEIRPYEEVLAEFKHAYEEVKRLEEEFSLLINS